MPLQLSPEAQGVMAQLPDVQAELQETEASLQAAEQELGGMARREAAITTTHDTAVASLSEAHSRAVFATYDRRLQKAMTVIAVDAENPFAVPAPEVCERVAQLDELIQAAAGQPVIVTKPGESWFDVTMLSVRGEDDMPGTVGLQVAYSRKGSDTRAVELPSSIRSPLAVDSTTGEEPRRLEDKHGDLRRRAFIRPDGGDQIRPAIDPLNTRVVASDVIPMIEGNVVLTDMPIGQVMAHIGHSDETEPEQETTFIVVGYSALQQVFNNILGFQPDGSTDGYMQFRRATQVQERLEQAGIDFQADFIDGVLSHRIAAREQTAEGIPEKSFYERTLIQALKAKRAQLIDSGWISV